jgi:diguanylate cyclase (GGDEF)-like protein/PAS domain S-box-containing protein
LRADEEKLEKVSQIDIDFYKKIVEQARDIILVVRKDGRIINANQAAVAAYGYSLEDLGNLRVHDLRAPETREAIDGQLKIAQQNGSLFRTLHKHRSGETFPVEVSSQRVHLTNEAVIVSIVRDITAAVALETTLKKSEEKFRMLNEELTATHEELIASEEELRQQFDELLVREETIRHQNIILTSLHKTAIGLMQRLDMNDVLTMILASITDLVETPHGYISLVEEAKGIFSRKIGLGYYAQDVGRPIKVTEGLVGQVYKSGEIAVIDDYRTWENRLSDTFFDQLHKVVQVPLKAGNTVVGTFGLAFTQGRTITNYELALLQQFAEIASIAVINAQLHGSLIQSGKQLQKNNTELTAAHEELLASEEELRQQLDELLIKEEKINSQNMVLTSLHETAMGLMHRLDLDDVLEIIMSSVTKLLGTSDGFINLVNEEQGMFIRKFGIGRFTQDRTWQTKITEGLLGQVYSTRQIVIVDAYEMWKLRLADPALDDLNCCAIVPLKNGDQVIGALGLVFSEVGRMFADHEIYLLQRFADLASIALDNAILLNSYKNELIDRKQAEENLKNSEAKYRAIFEVANDGIYIHELETGKIIDVNEKACKLCGYTKLEILKGNFKVIAMGEPPYSLKEYKTLFSRAIAGEPQLFEWKNKHKDSHFVWLEINLERVVIGKDDRILAITRDISERKAQEEAILQMAYYDSLTGLPNRRYLQERLVEELEKARRGEATGAVLFIDMDDLKMINDTLGHSCGDNVIIKAGTYILREAGKKSVVARIGGDEFVVLLPDESDQEKVALLADRMVKLLSQDYEIGDSSIHMTASVGIAIYPMHGNTVEDVFKNSDLALYAAKGSGKNTWCFYEAGLEKITYDNMILKRDLHDAVERGELSLQYQPLVNPLQNDVVGFEALLRWTSFVHGSVPPSRFIPLAEESDAIRKIGKWVIEEACRFARKLAELGKGDIRVSVNVSPRQLVADEFVALVREAIDSAGINPTQLELEITENALITSLEDSTYKLGKLRALGVHLSLDDFGTGYSSLTYLRSLPVGTLKIDKSFIDQIMENKIQMQFISSIVNMSHVLGMTVVAEGVETEEQLEKLVECQCDLIQGYLFSRPISEQEAILFLDRL